MKLVKRSRNSIKTVPQITFVIVGGLTLSLMLLNFIVKENAMMSVITMLTMAVAIDHLNRR